MSDTATLTLVDFLLARIAEDEAWAAEHQHFGDGTAPEWVPPFWTRVLAECESKRQIIEHEVAPYFYGGRQVGTIALTPVLRALAQSYADHPDYRDDWRV